MTYPIVYMIPYTNLSRPSGETGIQIGYTIADLVAKAGIGVLIYLIAVRKSGNEIAMPFPEADRTPELVR